MGVNEYINIGKRIKKTRIKQGLKQKDIAERLSMKVSTYSNYENGYREPDFDTILAIANELNVSVDYLTSSLNMSYDEYILYTDALADAAESGNFDIVAQMKKISDLRDQEIFDEEDWLIDIIVGKAFDLSDEARYKIIEFENKLIESGEYKRPKQD